MDSLIEIFRFDENEDKTSYSDFTVIVNRLDGEVDLHGFCGTPTRAKMRQLFSHLKSKNISHVNLSRCGIHKRYRVR